MSKESPRTQRIRVLPGEIQRKRPDGYNETAILKKPFVVVATVENYGFYKFLHGGYHYIVGHRQVEVIEDAVEQA